MKDEVQKERQTTRLACVSSISYDNYVDPCENINIGNLNKNT